MPRRTLLLGILITLALSLCPGARAEATAPPPPRSWLATTTPLFPAANIRAFIVGVLEWRHRNTYASFTRKNRWDGHLVGLFTAAGVPAERLTYIKDRKALKQTIMKSLRQTVAASQPGETLFVYYCGHGDADEDGNSVWMPYDASEDWTTCVAIDDVLTIIDTGFRGDRVILAADCCRSGGLPDAVKERRGRIAYAAFSSSCADEWSTGNWTFTKCIYDALAGHRYLDKNDDGVITLGELGDHAVTDMELLEDQLAAYAFTGRLRADTPLAVASGARPVGREGQPIEAYAEGIWWRGKVVKDAGERLLIHWVDIAYDNAKAEEWMPTAKTRPVPIKQFPVGSRVEVDWRDEWYPATVLKVDGKRHFVHYLDYGHEWDQWVTAARVRRPKPPKSWKKER